MHNSITSLLAISLLATPANAQFTSNHRVTSKYLRASPNDGIMRIHTADMDNDGIVDLLLDGGMPENWSGSEIENTQAIIMRGDGAGGFTHAGYLPKPGTHRSVCDMGDADGDGDVDLLMYSFWDNGFSLYTGAGNMTFTFQQFFAASTHGAEAKFTDLEGDGDMDIVTICSGSAATVTLHAYWKAGANYTHQAFPLAGANDYGPFLSITDFNGDGLMDATSNNESRVYLFTQQAGQSFTSQAQIMQGNFEYQNNDQYFRAYPDIDHDGKSDMTFLHGMNDDATLYTDLSTGAAAYFDFQEEFTAPTMNDQVANRHCAFANGDLDQDGEVDFVFAVPAIAGGAGPNKLVVVMDPYDRSGHYSSTVITLGSYINLEKTRGISLADADGNGSLDIVLGCADDSVRVFLNQLNVGIDENEAVLDNAVSLYPNPATEAVTVRIGNGMSLTYIEVLNAQGQVVQRIGGIAARRIDIPLAQYASGLYVVRVHQVGGGVVNKRLIVQ